MYISLWKKYDEDHVLPQITRKSASTTATKGFLKNLTDIFF